MCEGSPEVRATDGPASYADAVDDAYNRAYDELAERALELRQHVCLHPLHVDTSIEYLEAARRLALAVDAFESARAAMEQAADVERAAAEADPEGDVVAFDPTYLLGFRAGARAQHSSAELFARRRGWPNVSSALALVPVLEAPETAPTEGASHVPA